MRARTVALYRGELLLSLFAVAWLSGGQAAWAQVPASPQGQEKISPESIGERYRKILLDWSAGDTEKAPDALIALETAVVVDGEPKTRKILFDAEQKVIHQVGASDLEVLVPISVLHHEAYRRLLERRTRGEAVAMVHTRKMSRDLAVLYQQQSGSEGAALVASRVLTSLGGMLLQSAQQLPAAEMFQQASELDPRNLAAFLGLASIYEKNAQPESAVKVLRKALEAEPGNGEARLRLALNLKRLDQTEEARKLLEELVAVTDPSWVTPLGFQELARLHSDRGRTSEAEKILRKGVERFPGDTRLEIQLAAVLDRRGAAGEATALVEKILAAPAQAVAGGASDRFLYNTVRPEVFEPARSFLAENSKSRLPVLAVALAAPPADPSGTGVGR